MRGKKEKKIIRKKKEGHSLALLFASSLSLSFFGDSTDILRRHFKVRKLLHVVIDVPLAKVVCNIKRPAARSKKLIIIIEYFIIKK